MLGTPFLLGADERFQLEALREAAAKVPVDMPRLMEQLRQPRGKRRHMRQMTRQTVYLPFGFAVTYSLELNHPGGRTARHMSMSSPAKDRVPRPEAVWMVAQLLGFTGLPGIDKAEENLRGCLVWPEELQGHGTAINVVQFVAAAEAGMA